ERVAELHRRRVEPQSLHPRGRRIRIELIMQPPQETPTSRTPLDGSQLPPRQATLHRFAPLDELCHRIANMRLVAAPALHKPIEELGRALLRKLVHRYNVAFRRSPAQYVSAD